MSSAYTGDAGRDRIKCEVFDLAGRLTGKVPQYRGKH
jgi:hypothetical protein